MNKALIIFASLMVVAGSCFGTGAPTTALNQQYYDSRFVRCDWTNRVLFVDLKQLTNLNLDTQSDTWTVLYSNGNTKQIPQAALCGSPAVQLHKAWEAFRTFLANNPQFMSIP